MQNCNTTNVKCAHCELRTRLTNGLCGNNTNCSTSLYQVVGRWVDPVFQGSDSANLASGERREYLNTSYAKFLDASGHQV